MQAVSYVQHTRNIVYIPLQNNEAVAAADVVGNLGRVVFVVHEEKVNFPHVVDQKLLQTTREQMTGLKAQVKTYETLRRRTDCESIPSCCFRNRSTRCRST